MRLFLRRIGPAVVVMVDHQLGHPTVDADILSGNETRFVRA